jgi:hypothetical protein
LKKNNIYYLLVILLLSATFNSCTEKIDIDLDSDRVRLVVEGTISDIPGRQFVRLTETANYFSNSFPEPVSNASVKITDAGQVFILHESETTKGGKDRSP